MRWLGWIGMILLGACVSPPEYTPLPYSPSRSEYYDFRARFPELPEPNYLPFATFSTAAPDSEGDMRFFCRWSKQDFPLAVWVGAPQIDEEIQDEFHQRSPEDFMNAAEEALSLWESAMDDPFAFRRVSRPEDAKLSIELIGSIAPVEKSMHQVLGQASLSKACRVRGYDRAAQRFQVVLSVPTIRIFVADDNGLLEYDQVKRVALHEIGHGLGIRGHSPVPGDIMFEMARDRKLGYWISDQDANSLNALYQIPNGTIYHHLLPTDHFEVSGFVPPASPGPQLALSPHVDSRLGFQVFPPANWLRMETAQGMLAIDGVTWDYSASFQVMVRPYPSIAAYLARHGSAHIGSSQIVSKEFFRWRERRALRLILEGVSGDFIEQLTLIESGDGRVFIIIADSKRSDYADYEPWFLKAQESLEIWPRP